jgi:hypothetical protein
MGFLGLLILGLLLFLVVRSILNGGRMGDAERKIKNLEDRLKKLEQSPAYKPVERVVTEPIKKHEVTPQSNPVPSVQEENITEKPKETPAKETIPVIQEKVQEQPREEFKKEEPEAVEILPVASEEVSEIVVEPDKTVPAYYNNSPTKPVAIPEKPNAFWARMEKQFAENWTGILGAAIMVAGVVFFGIYAALKVTAFYRFLLITAFSVLLTAAFIYLKRYEKWVKLALWLRSSAGAVFLFGCLGSAGIPGLQWVFEPLEGILILSGGILINLFLGYIGGNQVYASLHVLLSLVALSIVPQDSITLVLAALVTLFGIALTYREKWNYHLLLTITSFFAYHLYWYFQQPVITLPYKILGIITVVVISISVALVHYRSVYKNKVFDTLPFIVHLVNWFYFGIGLYLYSSHMRVSTLLLSLGAIAAFFLARRARKHEITWLYYTDTLVAQATALIALLSLWNWKLNMPFILTAIFAEVLLYLVIMLKEKQVFLYRIGLIMATVTGFVLIIVSGAFMINHTGIDNLYEQAAELFFCFFTGTIFSIYAAPQNKSEPEIFILYGIMLAGIFALGNIALFITGTHLSTIYLAGGAIITFLLAIRVKKAEMNWLYFLDMLLSQSMAILALVTLRNWDCDLLLVLSSIYAAILLFIFISIQHKNEILYWIWGGALYLLSFALIAVSVMQINYDESDILFRHAGEIAGCFILGILFLFFGNTKRGDIKNILEPFGFFTGAFFAVIYLHLYHVEWVGYGAVAAGLVILYLKEKSNLEEIAFASITIMLSIVVISWYYLFTTYTEVNGVRNFTEGVPLLVLSACSIKWSSYFGKFHNWIGIYLFAIQTVILSYMVFNRISSFIPGVLWLVLSPVALELSYFARKKLSIALPYKNQTDRFLLHVGYVFIFFFLARHIFIHINSEECFGSIIKIRFLVELLALLIFCYWAKTKKPEGVSYYSWEYLQPMFIELIILFFVLTVKVETTVYWYPIIWILSAFIMAFLGNQKKLALPRLTFYALVMYWITALQVAFVTSQYVNPSLYWYDKASYSGSISILLQFVFLVYFYRKCSLSYISFPKLVGIFHDISSGVQKSRNSWIFYPLIICTGLFLYFSFDKSILTLLWVVECFMVFILSIVLKEKYFRYVALVALGICILRLIFFDLAQTSTLTRAFVFLGVGIIMLIMNSVYNKYKGRFGSE